MHYIYHKSTSAMHKITTDNSLKKAFTVGILFSLPVFGIVMYTMKASTGHLIWKRSSVALSLSWVPACSGHDHGYRNFITHGGDCPLGLSILANASQYAALAKCGHSLRGAPHSDGQFEGRANRAIFPGHLDAVLQ